MADDSSGRAAPPKYTAVPSSEDAVIVPADFPPSSWSRAESLISALSRRRRLISLCAAVFALAAVAHFSPLGSAATARIKKWRNKPDVHASDASRPAAKPPSERCPWIVEPPRPLVPVLGEEADSTYDGIGSLCLADYRDELLLFLQHSFPPSDTSTSEPTSLCSSMTRYLNATLVQTPTNAPERTASPSSAIPHKIHQTVKQITGYWHSITQSWPHYHPAPEWVWRLNDDPGMDEWMHESFTATTSFRDGKNRLDGKEVTPVLDMWRRLAGTPVMRTDLWRYLKLLKEGGIYSDADTQCIKPFYLWSRWDNHPAGGNDEWAGPFDGRPDPTVIVGIEEDVGDRQDWHAWWPRPLGISQWTIAAAPGHPILLDTIRHVLESLSFHFHDRPSDVITYIDGDVSHGGLPSIVELTGPGPFTDAVLRYLGVMTEGAIRWADLRGLPKEGRRIGDVLVLPMTAFSPGVGHSGAGDIIDKGAYVAHSFLGSWKHRPPDPAVGGRGGH